MSAQAGYYDESYPPYLWGPSGPPGNKGTVDPGDWFFSEPTITASDAANAAKLPGLGYVVEPSSVPWAPGAAMSIGTAPDPVFRFYWNETLAAWGPGAHAAARKAKVTTTDPQPDPQPEPDPAPQPAEPQPAEPEPEPPSA